MDRKARTPNQSQVRTPAATLSASSSTALFSDELKAKALKLGQDLSGFLDDQARRPDPRMLRRQPWEEAYVQLLNARKPYVEAIHTGYVSRFKQRTINLFNELAQRQIRVPDLHAWEIDPREMMPEKNVRKIADRLLKLAASMEPCGRPKLTEPEPLHPRAALPSKIHPA
jgi:hypothetical protein